ncbi:MAG TPA: helix-turn-helix transcriptional regulator [Flavisolibacter sp.]|jgi:transcriptional regulator with XRE-family HTH domain|nr:helix-turn-helix transcriptional regulator [Flavisolibacter sp.]
MKLPQVHEGRNIRRMREKRGYKQEYLASSLGITQQAVSHLEQRESVDEETLRKVAQILNTTPEEIQNMEETTINNTQNNYEGSNINGPSNNIQCTFNLVDEYITLVKSYQKLAEKYETAMEELKSLYGRTGDNK